MTRTPKEGFPSYRCCPGFTRSPASRDQCPRGPFGPSFRESHFRTNWDGDVKTARPLKPRRNYFRTSSSPSPDRSKSLPEKFVRLPCEVLVTALSLTEIFRVISYAVFCFKKRLSVGLTTLAS